MTRHYPRFTHQDGCSRRRPPLLRLSWSGTPELWCPDCGRCLPLLEGEERAT